jgi:hypothetical protein
LTKKLSTALPDYELTLKTPKRYHGFSGGVFFLQNRQPFTQNGLTKPYFSYSVLAIVKKRLKVYFYSIYGALKAFVVHGN